MPAAPTPPTFTRSHIALHVVCSKCAAVVPAERTADHADWHKRSGA